MENPAMELLGIVLKDLTEVALIKSLPHLSGLSVEWSHTRGCWSVQGQVSASYSETDAFDAVRVWAGMFGAEVEMSAPRWNSLRRASYRHVSASIDWEGTEVTVWTHVAETSTVALAA